MSQSPLTADPSGGPADFASPYMKAWQALGTMLKQGRSFSGHERNCCFLNLGDGRFADVSAATQLDLDCDGRALAAVDWDHDGDLDYWLSSRNDRAVRYLQNQLDNGAHFLSVRLEGRSCNRDAIGARLELYVSGQSSPWAIQTLKAGEGYLAQSSKWLHFGLGDQTVIDRIVVRWPTGEREQFGSLRTDSRYVLVQGNAVAEISSANQRTVELQSLLAPQQAVDSSARVVAHGPLPLPPLAYKAFDGDDRVFTWPDKPVLVNLWATWCQPCLAELAELEKQKQRLRAVELVVLPLCVDSLNESPLEDSAAAMLLEKIAPSFAGGMATTSAVNLLDTTRRTITASETDLPMPSSFLVNHDGQVVAIYLGPVDVDTLIGDVKRLTGRDGYPRERAIPFAGRWFTQPFPADLTAIPEHLVTHEKEFAADAYLEFLANTRAGAPERLTEMMAGRLGKVNSLVGGRLLERDERQRAVVALERSLNYTPADLVTRVNLASILQEIGKTREAIVHHRELLRIRPNNPIAANNIAWGLATLVDSTPEEVEEAVRLAEGVCQQTRFQLPATIDTLGVAYAAVGRFAEAIATTERAAAMARNQGNMEQADAMSQRLALYRAGKRYFANVPDR